MQRLCVLSLLAGLVFPPSAVFFSVITSNTAGAFVVWCFLPYVLGGLSSELNAGLV